MSLKRLDLFNGRTLRECFVKANNSPNGPLNETHVAALLEQYVLEQMKYLPGVSVSFSNRQLAAHEIIYF